MTMQEGLKLGAFTPESGDVNSVPMHGGDVDVAAGFGIVTKNLLADMIEFTDLPGATIELIAAADDGVYANQSPNNTNGCQNSGSKNEV
jgi:hypothetical protein